MDQTQRDNAENQRQRALTAVDAAEARVQDARALARAQQAERMTATVRRVENDGNVRKGDRGRDQDRDRGGIMGGRSKRRQSKRRRSKRRQRRHI